MCHRSRDRARNEFAAAAAGRVNGTGCAQGTWMAQRSCTAQDFVREEEIVIAFVAGRIRIHFYPALN